MDRNGSGDYTMIQPAVDAAASGDTILIGPGRYEEHAPFTVIGWTEEAYVAIDGKDLTLIGVGPDLTIIGPEAPVHLHTDLPKGIASVYESDLTVLNLTVENIRDGLYHGEGRLEIMNCSFQGCDFGVTTWARMGALIENCRFEDNISSGITTHSPARDIEVHKSMFSGLSGNLYFVTTINANVYNSDFLGGTTGVSHQIGSSGGVYGCVFRDIQNVAISVAIGSTATVEDNLVVGGSVNLDIGANSRVEGCCNRFTGGSYATIYNSHGGMELHGNHILNVGGHSVLLLVFQSPPDIIFDLTDNYWGTDDADTILAWIWDGSDDPFIHAFVQFQPYSTTMIRTEPRSWGSVKAMYR